MILAARLGDSAGRDPGIEFEININYVYILIIYTTIDKIREAGRLRELHYS